MSFSDHASYWTPRREKVFGVAPGVPLDRNAKARITVYVRAYNARTREKGQHTGPITRAFMDVLRALLGLGGTLRQLSPPSQLRGCFWAIQFWTIPTSALTRVSRGPRSLIEV